MNQIYNILSINKYDDTDYRKKDDLIVIDFERHFHYSYKDSDIDIRKYENNSYPIWFIINNEIHIGDEIKNILENETPKCSDAIYVNDDNKIMQYITSVGYEYKYKLLLDLKNHKELYKKLLSENYKKSLNISKNDSCIIINLIYTPNERAVKINKIKQNIKNSV